LAAIKGIWAPVQSASEVSSDQQVMENGYLPALDMANGEPLRVVEAPVHFDGEVSSGLRRAPEHGENTEEILLDIGLSWEDIALLKSSNALM